MFASGVHGCPVADAVQTRTVAPAIGLPWALKTMSSLRDPCARAAGAMHNALASSATEHNAAVFNWKRAFESLHARLARFAAAILSAPLTKFVIASPPPPKPPAPV